MTGHQSIADAHGQMYAATESPSTPASDVPNRASATAPNVFILFGERIGHPRRGGKPEFKEGRYPPLDVPACVCPAWARCKWGSSPL